MHVEAAKTRRIEDGLGQDQPIGDYNGRIEVQRRKGGLLFCLFQGFGRAHFQPAAFGEGMHGGGRELLPAPSPGRRLANWPMGARLTIRTTKR